MKEMSEMFRCSKSTIINWSNKGLFDVFRCEGKVLYPVESVDAFYRARIEKGIPQQRSKPFNLPSTTPYQRRIR